MNPLLIARNLRTEYLRLLKTAFHPRQPDLAEAFNTEIETDGFLTREPFIALAQPYKLGMPLAELNEETRRRFSPMWQTPFQHQADACRRILAGQPTVVATGTGSGKTEAFLMPIIDHCIRTHRQGEHSVKAILTYPMNALANDQCARIRQRMLGTDISFGRYTGQTLFMGKRSADAPENERVLRMEFRASPPDLLLTNYMMLEYMLMRGDGREIFRNHRVQFIVLDEVHTYHGTLGTDVACLLRRLREALRKSNADCELLFIGTSATLQAGEEGDPKTGIANFFTRLTGQQTPAEAVITESPDTPELPAGCTLPPPPAISEAELVEFDPDDKPKAAALVNKLAGLPAHQSQEPAQIWNRMALPYLLLDWLKQPKSINEIVRLLGERAERTGVPVDDLRREIEAALLVGPCISVEGPLKLRPRVHRFLRGLARFWRCTNPRCGKLLGEGIEQCDECECRALPLAMCRTCGWDFFMAKEGTTGALEPWTYRVSRPSTIFLFDPPPETIEVEREEDLTGEEEDTADSADQAHEAAQERADDESEDDGRGVPDAYLDPRSLRLGSHESDFRSGDGCSPRPVRLHHGRGTRCPVCKSRYGRFDILTPVSLGNSSALAHVSRVLMRDLPESQRKLLVFCDSRQDAAHQARFIKGIEEHLRLRRLAYQVLESEKQPHDFDWLVDKLYEAYVRQGVFFRSKKRDQQRRDKAVLEGQLLNEFAISPRVRASLERLGLVKVRYAGLAEDLAGEEFARLCADHDLLPALAAYSVVVLLDEMRQRIALSHEALTRRLYAGDELVRLYQIKPNRQVGIPVAFLPPRQKSDDRRSFKLFSTWNTKGNSASIQKLWRQLHGDKVTDASLDAVLQWLAKDENNYLSWNRIGTEEESGQGFQVNLGIVEFEVGRSFLRCTVCDKIASNELTGRQCCRPGCAGVLQSWPGPVAEGNLNALMAVENYAPALYPAEHSAAVSDEDRIKAENGFTEGVPPRPNLLACTPTLEMGINIGDLEGVAMRNIPPSPANYAQRSGRTGRVSRMGIVAGFSRNTPHDGYFFDHPEEIIAGAIPPPKFNLRNLEAIARHVRSLILEHAEIDFPNNLERFLGEKGQVVEPQFKELLDKVTKATASALSTASKLWSDVDGVTPDFLNAIASRFPEGIRAALVERAELLAKAAEEVRKLGEKIKLTLKEDQAQRGYRELAIRLREDNKYAYLPRVLAEAGLLPGYSFPSDPGSVSLGYDPEPVFGGRLQAQREFAPGQIVYSRGGRWRVSGIALHRPGSSRTSGQQLFDFTLCGSCGLANDPKLNFCARCSATIGDDDGSGLRTFTAWDAGAFQAWEAELAADSEEERMIQGFDVRPHPQLDTDGTRYQVGPWALDLREQEGICFINHGPKSVDSATQEKGESPGFMLCPICGEYFSERERDRQKKAKDKADGDIKDGRSQIESHQKRCSGQPRSYSLGHQLKADTLRLVVPGLTAMGEEGVTWAWSFVYAMIQGAIRLFEIDEDNLEAYVLTKTVKEDGGGSREEVLDILWIDRIVGGSGVLQRLTTSFPKVAAAALQHLDGHECPNSCYRCLRSYRNQRWHKLLDWRTALPFLRALTGEAVAEIGEIKGTAPLSKTEGPDWDEARSESCESPQELNLLKAIRAAGALPEPTKQHEVFDGNRLLTRADFAYLDCEPRLLIYVDGLEWHSSVRQRVHDNRTSNRLQMLGYRVLRFLGAETHNASGSCVDQIRQARLSES